jgi:carbonic anhydrase
MSNQNINITAKNISGKCDLKCSYSFKYSESNSTAKNNGVMITISYDSSATPPVLHNQEKYVVDDIVIVSPSIHLFNGANAPGEIIITHNPVKGGNNLKVCIPFKSSTESSNASQLVTDIISKVATNAPSDGDSTNLNISGFTLQNIVPRKPYFYYTSESTNWIVYGELESISLSASTISTLQQIIKPFPIPMPKADLFYNAKGPISGLQIGDGLYISCQPTGSSSDKVQVEYDKTPSSTTIDFSNMMNSPTFQYLIYIIIGCLLFVAIFYGIHSFFKYLTSDAPKINAFL